MINKYLTLKDLEEQETLTKEILKQLSPKKDSFIVTEGELHKRPVSNFIDLMDWTQKNFSVFLNDKNNLEKFVNNRIIINGQFFLFCKERGISIECLYKDAVISWKTDSNFEKYFVQGIFLIKSNDMEFIHAALFHKGNGYEDEVSFFVILSHNNYDQYIKLRNSFDEWVQSRDRSNLLIKVVDGDDIPYTKENTWDDLYLPNKIKTEIKVMVENFLSSKEFYVQNKIPWKRGLLLHGHPGCGKTLIIRTIISEYNFKPITVTSDANSEVMREAFNYAQEQSPSLLYFEDLDSLLEKRVDISTFLNLMDGISTRNGIFVIATANEVHKLRANITSRPSRFDRKFEIPLPTNEMAYSYLCKFFGKTFNEAKYKELAKLSEKHKFSYAYLKELYISTMFEALSNGRKKPITKDIDVIMKLLIKDKNLLGANNINTDIYFDAGLGD